MQAGRRKAGEPHPSPDTAGQPRASLPLGVPRGAGISNEVVFVIRAGFISDVPLFSDH